MREAAIAALNLARANGETWPCTLLNIYCNARESAPKPEGQKHE